MSNSALGKPGTVIKGFALVMESDVDLRAVICSALQLEGHRVESVSDCAGVLGLRGGTGKRPDDFVLALGAGEVDPDWETLRLALDEDAALSQAAVIVLLTIRNGLSFPARARIVQKPFAMEHLTALVASDMAARRPAGG
jgi:DNA-binding response OmpR family regulator